MAVKAFSSVSVIDYTDIGSVQLYLTSNQPTTVIYDPNTSGTGAYSPNWSVSPNLIITPVITYNGSNLALNATGLTINYTRKVGSATPTALTTGEVVSGGILTVSANKLSTSDNIITYICSITYTDPDTAVPITTEATLSYTLLSMATKLKSCEITGENVFLYDSNRHIVGSDTIILYSTLSNVSIDQWQYKNNQGNFVAFPTTYNTTNTGTTLTVKDTENIFNGRKATIKLATTDSNIYDIHVITQIWDGAAGTDTVSAVLTNENHYLPSTSDGVVKSWNGASSTIRIYEAGVDETSSWSITTQLGNGLNGTYDSSTYTFTPSALTLDTSYVDFVCTKQDYSPITKRFTLTKVQQGADGDDAVIYECEASSYAVNMNESGVYTPSTVTFYAYYTQGSTTTKTSYDGRFKIYTSTNGTTFTLEDTSLSNESSYTYTPSDPDIVMIKAELYESGGTTNLLDYQSVVITRDGITGGDGEDGLDGISMGLGNYQDVIPCNTSGNASAQKTINIPFYAYAGIVRIPVTATVGTLPSGVTVPNNGNTSGTSSANGLLVLNVANGATFGNSATMSGEITITLQCTYNGQTQSLQQKFTWTKNKQANDGNDGADAVILQIYSPDGGVIKNSSTNTTLTALLTSGTSNVTSNASYVWKKYSSGDYSTIPNATSSSLLVTPSMVTDLAFFQCEATYEGNPYSAYYTVDDITDPYVAYTFCTVSEFKNSQGFGAVYTRLYQNGVEVDPLLSTTFSNTPPVSPVTGDYYYHLDNSLKTCTLKKYNGSAWVTTAENYANTYNYYRIDKDGNSLDSSINPFTTARAFYVDPSMISGRMQFICEVTDNATS